MRGVALLLIAALLTPAPAAASSTTVNDMVAVPPPLVTMRGHVLMKDGVTPVEGAVLTLTGAVDGEPRIAHSARSGQFKVRLPAGQYHLQIARRMDVYKAAAVFRVPSSGGIDIDLLLVPDFEPPPEPAPSHGHKPKPKPDSAAADSSDPRRIAAGPDPVSTEPVVVGSVVDMVHSKSAGRWSRWAEALGFLGGLLAVALAAD